MEEGGNTIYGIRPNIDTRKTRQRGGYPEIIDEEFWEFFETSKSYSLLHIPGFYNIYQSLRYVADNQIPGVIIECGVFFGGSSIFMALARRELGLEDRTMHLFDTFEGFPKGSYDSRRGRRVRGPRRPNFFDAVVENFEATCGLHNIEFHQGPVEKTLDDFDPQPIALLRLDTDHYSSTRKELEDLYPLVSRGGPIIIDDYGHYDGARQATDEYLATLELRPLLNRIDGGIWAGAKPGELEIRPIRALAPPARPTLQQRIREFARRRPTRA